MKSSELIEVPAIYRTSAQKTQLRGFINCTKLWKWMNILFLTVHIVVTFYWLYSLNWEDIDVYFTFNLVVAMPSLVFALYPSTRKNEVFQVISWLDIGTIGALLVYNLYLVISVAPSILHALIFILYSLLTSSLMAFSFAMALELSTMIRKIYNKNIKIHLLLSPGKQIILDENYRDIEECVTS